VTIDSIATGKSLVEEWGEYLKAVNPAFAGGFVGIIDKGEITGNYYNIETSRQSKGIGGEHGYYDGKRYVHDKIKKSNVYGETTANMKRKETYEGWDFNNTWGIDSTVNGGYPYLKSVHQK
jgi:hypothetical protein